MVPSGEVYHVAGKEELTNLSLAQMILTILDKPTSMIDFIEDHDIRPGHDKRYALTCDKIEQAIGWTPSVTLAAGMRSVVQWYADNPQWRA